MSEYLNASAASFMYTAKVLCEIFMFMTKQRCHVAGTGGGGGGGVWGLDEARDEAPREIFLIFHF